MGFACGYNGHAWQIVLCVGSELLMSFVTMPTFQGLKHVDTSRIILFTLCQLIVDSLLAILIIYIGSLQALLKGAVNDTILLLDGMSEGLLILSDSQDKSVLFCNEPAQKLLVNSISP